MGKGFNDARVWIAIVIEQVLAADSNGVFEGFDEDLGGMVVVDSVLLDGLVFAPLAADQNREAGVLKRSVTN